MGDASTHPGPLAFGDFLESLRQQGFTFGVDDYLRVQELLNKVSGDCAPADLKTLLCPILATNKIQQEQFYAAFDSYFDLFRMASPQARSSSGVQEEMPIIRDKPPPVGTRKWLYVLAGVLLLALGLAVFMQQRRAEPVVTSPIANSNTPPEESNQLKNGNVANGAAKAATANQLPGGIEPTPESPMPLPVATPKDNPQKSFYRRYGNAIYLSAIFAPLVGFLIYEWYRFRRRKLMLEKQRHRKPPFVWPLRVEASAARLYDPQQLYSAARLMRRRQIGEFYRLDIAATVDATIGARGYPSFRYKRDSKPPEYLVLIDRRSFRDHQARLFDELAKALEREGLFIARYFYEGDPRVCRNETGGSVDLLELQNKYAEHRLLIFGDGEKLINPVTGRLEAWAAMFSDWPQRALLTPEAQSQWSLREIILADQFILLPATLEGLSTGVDSFELPVTTDLRAWQADELDAPPADLESPGVVDRLRGYLGEAVFQWLCACAVYTEIHWDLTLYLGSLACMPQGLVKEENVLKLIRLPWFRSGAMPDELRWSLIHELDREKEKAIRAAIIELMEKNPPPQETFAADAYQLNLVVQRWLSRRERKRRREMLQTLKTIPQSRAVRDYTVLRFLESTRLSSLDFLLPRRLRRLFYRRGIPAFGLRTGARLLGALSLSAIALLFYFGLYRPGAISTPHASFFSKEDLLQRNIANRSGSNSCFDCHSVTVSVDNKCVSCHTTEDSQTAQAGQKIIGFQPTIDEAHAREGIGCVTCHTEHKGQDIRAGLDQYGLCSNCHNGAYKIKTGERAGNLLPVPHGGTVGYPVVNGKWVWKLTADEIKRRGYPDKLASAESPDQFHAVHVTGRMAQVSCSDCHSKGVFPDEAFHDSPKAECAKCHSLLITDTGVQAVRVNCNTCHLEHGQSQDMTKLLDYLDGAEAHYKRGNTLFSQHKYTEAEAEFRKAIELDPNDANAHNGLGLALSNQLKYAEAEAEYRKAIELNPNDAIAHSNLGIALTQQQRLAQAEAEFRKAIKIDPNYANAHKGLGENLDNQGRHAEAEAEYRKVIEIDPNDATAHNNLGFVLEGQAKYAEAEVEYKKAIEIDPNYAIGQDNLKKLLIKLKRNR